MTKTFPLHTVLTITTGAMLCPIENVYAILNHMTGDTLYTHQLPRACRECRPWLLRWFSELAVAEDDAMIGPFRARIKATDDPAERRAACSDFLRDVRAALPIIRDTYEVPQIPQDDHEVIDPVKEMTDMVGPDKVVVIDAKGGGE